MNKLVVVGGSRGIGMSLIHSLQSSYKEVVDIDLVEPLNTYPNLQFTKFDLSKDDIENIKETILSADTLIITAGIGSVKPFTHTTLIDIKKTFEINTVSVIEILKIYYERLCSADDVKCLVMGSIAGDISSPLFALYGSSKAAINNICDSLNIELIRSGSNNRITCIKPVSIPGTSFTGKETNLEMLESLTKEFINAMNSKQTEMYYEKELCENILKRYHDDKEQFGLSSYDYKMEKGRVDLTKKNIIGYLSGTFDLFHVGHLNLLRRAKQQCDYLIVGVHGSGAWKGKETFIPLKERMDIVGAIKYVDKVIEAPDDDLDAWKLLNYDRLFVGSDYKGTERFNKYEQELAGKVKIVYFEYTKGTSSTQIRELIKANK